MKLISKGILKYLARFSLISERFGEEFHGFLKDFVKNFIDFWNWLQALSIWQVAAGNWLLLTGCGQRN